MCQDNMCTSPEEAVARLLTAIPFTLSTQVVNLDDALGRVAAQDICAPFNHPPFDRSPLDGYAAKAADTAGACRETPAILKVVGEIFAGMSPAPRLQPGEAIRIMTGAPIPAGADCVIRQEDTDYGSNTVRVYVAHKPFQNYCHQGEDVRQGACCISCGTMLDFSAIGVLALLGQATISVFSRPTVGLLTTGSELVEVGMPLTAGKIYNSNQHLLSARMRELGALPRVLPKCADDPDCIAKAISCALDDCQFLVTTGGVSVGKKDFMPEVCHLLDGRLLFQGIPIKPGAPAMAFQCKGKLVLCLSGNPFAAAATFELLARPVIMRLQGQSISPAQFATAVLQTPFSKASPGRRFLRAYLQGGKVYLPEGGMEAHSSGALFSMMGCNCMIDIPAGTPCLSVGQEVNVILL